MGTMAKLEVTELSGDQMYKDTVQVDWTQRSKMKNGDIVKVTVANSDDRKPRCGLFAIRGQGEASKLKIGIDFLGLQTLNVKSGNSYEFKFERTGLMQ